jgi:hypothetical protein
MQIAASVYASPPSSGPTSPSPRVRRLDQPGRAPDGMVWLQRREEDLEQDLHKLLDAQSDALMAGIGGGGGAADDRAANLSPRSPHDTIASSPTRQPDSKPKDLLSVRRDIYRTVRELTAVKSEEESLLRGTLRTTESTLNRIEVWEQKRTALKKEIDTIRQEDIETRTQNLRTEADTLQDQITEMEQKLNRMRQRHARLLEQISQIENSVQSRLSTYEASLNLLDEEIQQWLARPPSPSARIRSQSPHQADFYSLPASRRTLEIAWDHWSDQHKSLDQQRKNIRREKRALEQGALVWKEVITEISSFEALLQKEMSSMNTANSPESMASLLAKMDDVVATVEQKLELATNKNWNLLIACIGAELEAFRQGRDILQKAAGQYVTPDFRNEDLLQSEYESSRSHIDVNSPRQIKSPKRPSSTRHSRILSRQETDSDHEPDPALLVTKLPSDSD